MKILLLIPMLLFVQFAPSQTMKGFDLKNTNIPIDEIKDGGPPKDRIPSVDKPKFIKDEKAQIYAEDGILRVYENGIAKAYPIRSSTTTRS